MDPREQVRWLLTERRASITPEQVGLLPGCRRRVTGLRREEVAMLAGISVDTYIKLERGHLFGVPATVLDAVAAVLQLEEGERARFHQLSNDPTMRLPKPSSRQRRRVSTKLRWVLEGVKDTAAHVLDAKADIVAANSLGRELFSPVHGRTRPANLACFVFLDPGARTFFVDWEETASRCVTYLRRGAATSPNLSGLPALLGDLGGRSEVFRRLWAADSTPGPVSGKCRLRHPRVGELTLVCESMELEDGLRLDAYLADAEEGTIGLHALALMGSGSPGETGSTEPDRPCRWTSPGRSIGSGEVASRPNRGGRSGQGS